MNSKFLLLLSLTWLVSACVSPTASVSKTYTLDPQSEKGLLIGSVKYRGALSGYKVYFKGLNNNESGYFEAGQGIMLIPMPPSSDFKTSKGKLQATELPAGEYIISQWGVTSGYANLRQTQPFSIRFKIEPGKATYIGSFIFTVTDTLGLTVTGVKLDFEDRYTEDIAVLRQKYPNLKDIPILKGLEPNLVKKDVGGSNSTSWDMPPVFF